jgi:hypothetical protein
MSGNSSASPGTSSNVVTGLKPRLYVVDTVANKLVYKADTYFQYDASDGFYKFNFKTSKIACIPSTGRVYRFIVVFCDPLGAPKFASGCGDGKTTVTELTPVTSDAGVAEFAGTASSAVVAAVTPHAVAAAVITTVSSPNNLTATTGAKVTFSGTFPKWATGDSVSLRGWDNGVAWTAAGTVTSANWLTTKVTFYTPIKPHIYYGDMLGKVGIGTTLSSNEVKLTVGQGSASGDIRLIKGSG